MKNIFLVSFVLFVLFCSSSQAHASDELCDFFKPEASVFMEWDMEVVHNDAGMTVVKYTNPTPKAFIKVVIATFTLTASNEIFLILFQYSVEDVPCISIRPLLEEPSSETFLESPAESAT